jgi:hypothetical protein
MISNISSDIKDFKSTIINKVDHVMKISQNMTQIKDDISKSQLNQVSEI